MSHPSGLGAGSSTIDIVLDGGLTQNDDTSTRAHKAQLIAHNIIQRTNYIIAIVLLRS